MLELLNCIFVGMIAFSSVYIVLFSTFIYDGRNVIMKDMDRRRLEAGLPTSFVPVNLWERILTKLKERRINKYL